MREKLADYCIRMERLELLEQWDNVRNLPVTPGNVSYGRKRKVWWRCNRGHTWQAAIYTRAGSGVGCPYCQGKMAWPGETDLATQYPDLARQWHPTKNETLTPEQVLPGSHQTVWWACEKGHEWKAQIKSRVIGNGCPVCANRETVPGDNDLASRYPKLAAQWHPTKNGTLTPRQVTPGSRRKVWWMCEEGHVWQATVASRTTGRTGCPVCAGKVIIPGKNDLASQYPHIAVQWNSEQNEGLTPQQVSPCSNRKVWWRCSLGHEYRATVASRTMRDGGCPYCAGTRVLPGFNDLATREPQLAAQWHPTLNGALTPEMVTAGSRRKVWWQCSLGHVWKAAIYSRTGTRQCGCPVCAGKVSEKRQARYDRVLVSEATQTDQTAGDRV